MITLDNLQHYAESLTEHGGVPAVSLAVWRDNTLSQAAAGVLNIETGVKATPDAIFQIGSITKVFTASLVMQLVDQGRVNLDDPVIHYLRDFRVADTHATRTITVRQLLNHTNGIAGDYFPDDADASGNAIARYVDRINLLPLVHQPGEDTSYSNAAFAVAGRLLEVVIGLPWHQIVVERIFKPLGMNKAIADPKESLRYRAAIGHFPDQDHPSQWRLSPNCYSSLGLAPAGLVLSMSAAELMAFARAHLDGGTSPSGSQWLSTDSLQLMQAPATAQAPLSDRFFSHRGLGWSTLTDKRSGVVVLSHEGMVAGQNAMLRLIPSQNSAFVVLLNGVKAGVMQGIVDDLMTALLHQECAEPPAQPISLSAAELTPYTGTYESFASRYQVTLHEASSQLKVVRTDKLHKTCTQQSWRPLGEGLFAAFTDTGVRLSNLLFTPLPQGAIPDRLYINGRLNHRVGSTNISAASCV